MVTTLKFVSSSRSLADATVRLEDGRELEVDDDGRLDVDIEPGRHQIELLIDDQWTELEIELSEEDDSPVVDVDEETSMWPADLVGRTLGDRYHIEEALGQGGMGTVYRGWDQRLERSVAIKTLNPRLEADDEASRLFFEEARQMASLSHPHLKAVHDVAADEGQQWMVTELVEGFSLEECLEQKGPPGVDEALVMAYQLAIAVAYLHEQQVIHRDLKPANALVEPDGKVKLVDFGLARSLEHLVNEGTHVRGTPAYMAPEQLRGPGPSGPTDIYQLGVTFYELLTGRLPAEPDEGGMLARVTASPDPITDHRPDLPEELVDLIHECLAAEPDDRPGADELADRLAELYLKRSGERPPSSIPAEGWATPAAGLEPGDDGPRVEETKERKPPDKLGDEDSLEAHWDIDKDPDSVDTTIEESPPDLVGGRTSGDDGDEPSEDRRPARPPGDELPGRDPDFTGAAGTDDVEWDRPVARIARIVAIIALVFAAAVLIHFLFFDGGDQQAPAEPEEQQIEEIEEGASTGGD